ncbi:MAG: transketolase C-terminal domain-containing protein [Desulfobacterales bacterium]|jgi:pyruvate ferredoxin oxidoreductase alpha subunit
MSPIPANATITEGSEAVAQAVRACRPEVISAFPISPQTHIVEGLARMAADGSIDSEYVRVESEFSAASVLAGASAAGARSYSASSSQGLLLMTEVLYASVGQRLPFVITGVNRSISAPISIQIDQRDTMSLRDSGMIQLYVESSQEAYDTHVAAFKIAEDPDILLPVMVCMDGWVLTHSYELVSTIEQEAVDAFLPAYNPPNFLDPADPKTWGSYSEADVQMEINYSVHDAMQKAKSRMKDVFAELAGICGRDHGGLIEAYRCDDAEVVLIALGSVCGTIKDAIDDLRATGQKVGLIKIRCYRPFPYEEILEALNGAKVAAVMEASFSMGSEGSIGLDLKAKLCNRPDAPMVVDFIAGLGGREVNKDTVATVVGKARQIADGGRPLDEPMWIDLNRDILP